MIKKFFCLNLLFYIFLFSNNISHASDIASEGRIIISNPDVLYTIYLGMPRDYVDINFSGAKGWDKSVSNFSNAYNFTRKITTKIEQDFTVQFDSNNNVKEIKNTFIFTDSKDLENVFLDMLNSLNKKYGSPQKAKMTGVRYRGGGIWYANGHKYELSRYYWGKTSTISFTVTTNY